MPDLASLQNRCAHLVAEWGDQADRLLVNVYYRPQEVTGDTQRAIVQSGGDLSLVFKELSRILIAWDLTDKGEPVPVDVEGFGRVPIGLSMAILQRIMDDMRNPTWVTSPPPATQTRSSNGWSATAPSATAPTTTTPSSPPSGPESPHGTWPAYQTPPVVPAGSDGSAASSAR